MRHYPGAVPWRFVPVSAETLTAAGGSTSSPEAFRRQVARRRQQADVRDKLRAKAREFRRQALRDHVARARAVS